MRFCQQPRLEGWAGRAARSSPKPRVSRGSAFGAGITASSRQDVGLRFYADGAFTVQEPHREFIFSRTPFVNVVPAVGLQASGGRGHKTHPELSERPAAWLTRDSSLPHAALQGDTEGGPSLSATLWPCRQSTFAHRALTAKPRSCQQPATSAPPTGLRVPDKDYRRRGHRLLGKGTRRTWSLSGRAQGSPRGPSM